MDIASIVILANTLTSIGLFIATLYRIKIERDQIRTTVENAKAVRKLEILRKIVELEKDQILEMNGKEVLEFLKEVCKDEN